MKNALALMFVSCIIGGLFGGLIGWMIVERSPDARIKKIIEETPITDTDAGTNDASVTADANIKLQIAWTTRRLFELQESNRKEHAHFESSIALLSRELERLYGASGRARQQVSQRPGDQPGQRTGKYAYANR